MSILWFFNGTYPPYMHEVQIESGKRYFFALSATDTNWPEDLKQKNKKTKNNRNIKTFMHIIKNAFSKGLKIKTMILSCTMSGPFLLVA